MNLPPAEGAAAGTVSGQIVVLGDKLATSALFWRQQARDRVIAIVDAGVVKAGHEAAVLAWLATAAVPIDVVSVPGGEATKSLPRYSEIMEELVRRRCTRDTLVVAVGGGATTDFAGFVAATLLRGVRWLSVPTTLLGMVDAGIGGKVGLNCQSGKNQIGAFHLPEVSLLWPTFLTTLAEAEWHSGLGELAKSALLDSQTYAATSTLAAAGAPPPFPGGELIQLVAQSAAFKMSIVREDFTDRGRRHILNFGHTFGHVFETKTGLRHGIAVAAGIDAILEMDGQAAIRQEARALFTGLGLKVPTSSELKRWLSTPVMAEALTYDKKRGQGDLLKIVTLESLGTPVVRAVPRAALVDFWDSVVPS